MILTPTILGSVSTSCQVRINHETLFRAMLTSKGPQGQFTTLHKRDDSHWELFDCDNSIGEERQTVKAVCTNSTEHSNCGDIFIDGVSETVIEMPGNCGPGKYAIAVGMELSTDHSHLHQSLFKRGLGDAAVYDLTFDYDFSPIQKRSSSDVLLRIDYSDDPGYWASIVEAKAGSKRKRDLDLEVEEHFDGNHKAWLEAQWHLEKRSMPPAELHKRWWSGDFREWLDRQKKVSVSYTGIQHTIAVLCSHFLISNGMILTHGIGKV